MKKIAEIEAELEACGSLTELNSSEWMGDPRKGVAKSFARHRKRLENEALMQKKYEHMSRYEHNLKGLAECIAGVDEAGRGPIAGEVVAAAVVLPEGFMLPGLDDSKKLSLKKRMAFREIIMAEADYGIGTASVEEIDRLNIYQASRLAMERAVTKLSPAPDHLLVDAMTIGMGVEETSIIKGDANSVSIAAASVLAKTERDLYMEHHDAIYPGYGFCSHKGYGTADHLAALEALGPCAIHRHTFEPVKSMLLK